MLGSFSEKLQLALKKIRGATVIHEKDLAETLKAVRLALLEADVHYQVAKDFCARVAEKAKGQDVLKSLTPDQQIIKIVNDELVQILGGQSTGLDLSASPPIAIMLVGLQGAGKTTTAGKLALYIKKTLKRNPLLVPADIYRPAAIDQLKILGKKLEVDTFDSNQSQNPVDIAKAGMEFARGHGQDVVIIDTAGRLQIDQEMMQEIQDIEAAVNPKETLLVADAMTGQEAVNVAAGFAGKVSLTGLILTKLDGDARGGAALSMLSITGKPIKFAGVGEKLEALEVFHPDRLASRILGMGDVLSLIEKAQDKISQEEAMEASQKMLENDLDFEMFLSQLRMMKKMGSVSSMLSMLPGAGKIADKINPEEAENELKKTEAIILSMTKRERRKPEILDGSRRKRIAKGSGTDVADINRLIKQFQEMQKFMRQMKKGGMSKLLKAFGPKLGF